MWSAFVPGLLVVLAFSRSAVAQCAVWDQGFGANGLDNTVLALRVHNDGSGPALYAGGTFTMAGGRSANKIAKWNGTSWSALDTGVAGGNTIVHALEVFDDGSGPALYAGGFFAIVGGHTSIGIAKWNGTNWSPLGNGTGITFEVVALCVFDDGTGPALYAGGVQQPGSFPSIAKWDGASWSSLGSGLSGAHGSVLGLAVYDDGSGPALYVSGNFNTAGGAPADDVAKWNGVSWSAVGSGTANGFDGVGALAVFDDGSGPALYAAGSRLDSSATLTNNIARWNGTNWSSVGQGVNGSVGAFAVYDDGSGPALYAGGAFTDASGTAVVHVAKWNGTTWSALGSGVSGGGVNDGAYALAVYDDGLDADADLFVGGGFTTAGGFPSARIAKWNGCGTQAFCFGDGSALACPCANNGTAGRGCNNSAATGGALLTVTGSANPDSVVLTSTGELASALTIFLQGDRTIAPTPFGDGLRCAGGHLKRLYAKSASGGSASAPQSGDPSITARSAALGDLIAPGSKRFYQVFYRDPVLSFCPPPQGNSWNVGNATAISW